MSVKNLRFSQTLPISKAAAWNFFSDPKNLSKITPKEMNFVIHSDISNNKTYPGQIICYTVSPLFNIPLNWVTEITHVKEKEYFIDQQRSGPYSFWHHQHKIEGVVVNDENIYADIVVSNADVYFTYHHLLKDDHQTKRVLKQERSCSGVIFYWGMNREFSNLHLHNIFFSKNYAAEFNSIFKLKNLYIDPTVYVNITSKMETGQAPAGKENWFILINAPSNIGQNWEQLRLQIKQKIIEKLSRLLGTDIAAAIETEKYLDPIGIEEQTGSYMGSLYGTSSNGKMAAFLRHPNFKHSIKGLYFCGGSVHPGGGIPLCFKSAKIATDLIQKDYSKPDHH